MTSTNNFVGIRDAQRISSRVLKPPGGGSSIVFDEDENMKPVKSKPQQQQQEPEPQPEPQPETQPEPQPKQEAPQAEKQEPPQPQQQAGDSKPETNGMNNIDCVKENAAATRDSNPSPATNGQHTPALNGPPAVNGSSATNGSMSSGSTSSMSSYPSGTPKHFNTQTRIFGDEQNVLTPRRRLRDHERSNIFSAEEASSNGTHRPADNSSSSSSCPSNGTPEARTPEQAQLQQRQRVPPGGFSTRLW